MTLEEAKKILEKEGFKLGGPGKPGKSGVVSEAFVEYESPEICEAMQIVCSAGFQLAMLAGVFDERKERLKKEHEKNTKAPGSGEEQSKEKKGIIYPTTFPKADFYHKHVLDEGNTALRESASQFNDALLDEQTKKIKRLGKEIAKLNGIIHDKNAILSDVAEELRLTKIREKNLAELGLKYVGENEKLKKELADKVIDEINANALKSAESALACKEQLIYYKDKIIAYYKKKYVWYKGAYDAAQQILNTIADYAAKHPDKKISDPMVEENYPTIDNPEEIEIEKAVKLVRKAMKGGHTVTIDYKD